VYREFFGLESRPFGKTPDPAFLFESRRHREALARLEYAVEEMDLALLTGPIGSGKTTITRALLDRMGGNRKPILLIHPRLSPSQLLRAVAEGLGAEPRRGRTDLVSVIHEKLFALHEAGSGAVIIIDEAQLIPGKSTFDEIRLLTNFQLDDENLVSIVLVGQPELDVRLRRREYDALRQRIGIRYSLDALDAEETARYIGHRVRTAGGAENPFTPEACLRIHELTGGVPRLINALATTSLLEAFGRESRSIGREIVDAAAKELDLPVEGVRRPSLKAVKNG
jgi:type II secretory pathway predicted ATPase ExeA